MTHFTNPHFAEPRWLWLAALGPVLLIALLWYSALARKKQLARLAAPAFLRDLTSSYSPARRFVKNTMAVLAVASLGIALARPQWGEHEQRSQLLGEDVVFILDCSASMMARDVAPDRLQRAKLAIANYVQRHGRGRVGLVAFAGQAFLQCPLTFDYGAFEDSLAAIDDKTIPVPGTDIGRALDEGFRAMDKGNSTKILILLTDGEDLEKDGIRMAGKLAKQGCVVFTLGVGTPAGSELVVQDEHGQRRAVRSRLDEKTLRAIAESTHGAYFPLGPVGEGLAKVRIAAESIEIHSGSAPARKWGVERFHVPVTLLLVLLISESLIGTRRGRWRVSTLR